MKLLVKTVASTAVVLVALAGCASRSSGGNTSAAGGSTTSAPSSGTTSTQNGSQPSPGAPSGQQSGSGSQPGGQTQSSGAPSSTPSTDPSAQVKYISPQGVSVDKDGITLVTEVEWGGCDDQPQLVVMSQDASKVVVELKKTSHARIGVMCPDIARQGQATVKLAAPLGSRPVIDGIKNTPITAH
jgi:hypothetical protein